jgi:hypothetical protein
MYNPIQMADRILNDVMVLMARRLHQMDMYGPVVERDAMLLYRTKVADARKELAPILKGLDDAQRQGGQPTTTPSQPGGTQLPVRIRQGDGEDATQTVQPEDQGNQGKDG